jgi:hypothetical protein
MQSSTCVGHLDFPLLFSPEFVPPFLAIPATYLLCSLSTSYKKTSDEITYTCWRAVTILSWARVSINLLHFSLYTLKASVLLLGISGQVGDNREHLNYFFFTKLNSLDAPVGQSYLHILFTSTLQSLSPPPLLSPPPGSSPSLHSSAFPAFSLSSPFPYSPGTRVV